MEQEQRDQLRAEILAKPEGQKVLKIAAPLAEHLFPPAVVPSFLETVKDVWIARSLVHSKWIGFAEALDDALLYAHTPAQEEERIHSMLIGQNPIREIRTGQVPGSKDLYLVYGELSQSHNASTFAVLLRRTSREDFGEIVGMYEKGKGYATRDIPGVQPLEALEQTLRQPLKVIIPTLQ